MKWIVVWIIITQLLLPSGKYEAKPVVNKVVFYTEQEAVDFVGDNKDMFIIEEVGDIDQTIENKTDCVTPYTLRNEWNNTQTGRMDSTNI